MSLINLPYKLMIAPLTLIFDFIFSISYTVTKSAGISLMVLSFIVNILVLPLYSQAEKIQKDQTEKEKQLKPIVDHIKKSFKGDERYMVLQTYYRQNQYKQTDILKSSISLLLQIPFFIAAYNYLNNLSIIKGSTFFLISDLSSPDKLITLFGTSINVLPILMTLINIISSIIYLENQPLKSKIQTYGLAIIFFVVLYNAPSALILYYLLNNIFSLMKNIINKTKKPKLLVAIICSLCGVLILTYILLNPLVTIIQQIGVIIICILLQLPTLVLLIKNKNDLNKEVNISQKSFICSCIFMGVFYGLYIPSTVINSSVYEFVDTTKLINPLIYILNTAIMSFGFFGLWLLIYYKLSNNRTKRVYEIILEILCVVSIINYMFFGTNVGRISNILVYDSKPCFEFDTVIVNVIVDIILIALVLYIDKKKKSILNITFISGLCVLVVLSSIYSTNIFYNGKDTINDIELSNEKKAQINLSKTKNNVVVIILDAAVGAYFPYILEEKPELIEQYSGFTYYPNTLSFGDGTAVGMPSVYGGYEYSPEKINERSTELRKDKYNEAIKIMPTLFDNIGYDVTIFDPAITNANFEHDISIFDYNEKINVYKTTSGMFKVENLDVDSSIDSLNRNLFCYSLMKCSPLLLRNIFYNEGSYLSIDNYNDVNSDNTISTNKKISQEFINNYAVLKNLINITNFSDNSNFLLMYNATTHENTILQKPEYEPNESVNNISYDKEHEIRESIFGNSLSLTTKKQASHYDSNMCSIIEIGKWLEFLKENDVYDNTRIIIVSDHARSLNQFDDWILKDNDEVYDLMKFNPILLFKDYNSNEFSINQNLMFNADTVSLAIEGIIDNPVNPFTGKELSINIDKTKEKVFVSNRGTQANSSEIINGYWYSINNSIFDVNNWIKINNQ